jgi:hypothetical protein
LPSETCATGNSGIGELQKRVDKARLAKAGHAAHCVQDRKGNEGNKTQMIQSEHNLTLIFQELVLRVDRISSGELTVDANLPTDI